MAASRLLPNAVHFSEFQNDPQTGHHYTATCGETALAAAMVAVTPAIETTQQAIDLMTAIAREMIANKSADAPNGSTTTAHLHQEAIARGFAISDPYIEFTDPIDSALLHPLLLAVAGVRPIVLMITNGQALLAVDGSHTEIGLHGHFICVVGIEPRGYICMDGDNSSIANALPIYPWAAIEAAHPTGYLSLEMPPAVDLAPALAKAQNDLALAVAQASALQTQLDAAQMSGAVEALAAMRAIKAALPHLL